jgi:hypothetical protein
MADFNEILKDSAKYPDNLEVDFAGAKVPLGSLRQFTTGQLADIDKRQKAIEKEYADAKTARESAMDLSQRAQQLWDSLQQTKPAASTPAGEDPWETDPIYAPVRNRFTERDKQVKDLKETLEKLAKTQEQLALVGGWDRWERQYNAFPKERRPKDKSLEDLVKYAAENKLVDRFGIPSVEKAIDQMTAGDRLEEIRKQARAEGAAEAETRLRASTMPRPNFNPSPASRGGGKAPLEDLDQLTDKVLEDPELRQLVEGLNLQ